MFVKPTAGRLVPDPATSEALPPAGKRVEGNPVYWFRRVQDGDVTEIKQPAKTGKEKD